jgi:hypothetical protein
MTGGSYDSAAASHRALRAIQTELERHPIVTDVRGFPTGEFTEVTAQLETRRWGVERPEATLTVRWFAGETVDANPEFSVHYSDDETDFGWHHHDQDHVDGCGHFQKQTAGSAYTYEPHSFSSTQPSRLVWAVMSLLSAELDSG